MKLENLRIIVDERETKSGIPKLLKAIGMNVEMKTLPIGDYIVAPETIVERMSWLHKQYYQNNIAKPTLSNRDKLFLRQATFLQMLQQITEFVHLCSASNSKMCRGTRASYICAYRFLFGFPKV